MADLAYGNEGVDDAILWGDDALAWGPGFDPLAEVSYCIRHVTLRIKEAVDGGQDVRIWTGPGDLTHGGHVWGHYPPTLVGFGDSESSREVDDSNRMRVTLFLPQGVGDHQQTGVRLGLNKMPKIEVELRLVYSLDGGETWEWFPNSVVKGVMSSPQLTQAQGVVPRSFSFDIATPMSNADRGYRLFWDNATQQKLYPGANDRGFEHMQKFASGLTYGTLFQQDDPSSLR